MVRVVRLPTLHVTYVGGNDSGVKETTRQFETTDEAEKMLRKKAEKLTDVDIEKIDGNLSATGFDKDGNVVTIFNFEDK